MKMDQVDTLRASRVSFDARARSASAGGSFSGVPGARRSKEGWFTGKSFVLTIIAWFMGDMQTSLCWGIQPFLVLASHVTPRIVYLYSGVSVVFHACFPSFSLQVLAERVVQKCSMPCGSSPTTLVSANKTQCHHCLVQFRNYG